MKKKTLGLLALLLIVTGLGWGTTLPSYTGAITNSAGTPIVATITVYAAGTTSASTIYSEATGTTAKTNPFVTDTLGRFTFYAATGLYDIQVSGTTITTYTLEDVVLGLYGEDSTLTKTETGYGGSGAARTKSQISQTFSIAPGGAASTNIYHGNSLSVSVSADNAYAIGALRGFNLTTTARGSGAIDTADGILSSLVNYATTTYVKNLYNPVTNYGTSSGFIYANQSDISNWSLTGLGAGDVHLATAARLRIQNSTSFVIGTPSAAAHIDDARVIHGNIVNEITGTGSTLGPTIDAAYGGYFELSNGANSTITTSKYFHLATPSNSGTWTNHYGIYLADQTISGTTLNFALYSAGSTASAPFSIRPPVALGLPTSAMTLENGQLTFSVNESTHVLTITVKYSDGTTKTATINLI